MKIHTTEYHDEPLYTKAHSLLSEFFLRIKLESTKKSFKESLREF